MMNATAQAPDLLVVGAGVFGLWTATAALRAGLRPLVVEATRVGAGASHGLLGALTAHSPERWNDKKAFQLAALLALPDEVAALEAATGLAVGYARVGRISPIRKATFLAEAERRAAGAVAHWAPHDPSFVLAPTAHEDAPAAWRDWLAPAEAPHGVLRDGLAARISPRAYVAALAARLRGAGVEILEGVAYQGWADGAALLLDQGGLARRPAGAVALCGGWRAFAAIADALSLDARAIGVGVKGQSALFEPAAPVSHLLPVLYDDGVYVIAHDDGRLAVGSTSETAWSEPDAADPSENGYIERARALCPALVGARLVERWAGVRPRAATRDPLLGRLPVEPPLYAVTGGFKIGFGVAHACAAAVIDEIVSGAAPSSVARFSVDALLARRAGATT